MPTPKKSDDFKLCGMCWKDDKVTFQHVSNTYLCNRCGYKWSAEKPSPQQRPGLKFGYRGPRFWRKRQAGTIPLIPVKKPEEKPITATEILQRREEWEKKHQEIFGKPVMPPVVHDKIEIDIENLRGMWPESFKILDEADKKAPPEPDIFGPNPFFEFLDEANKKEKERLEFKAKLCQTFEEAKKAKIKAKCNHNKIQCLWARCEINTGWAVLIKCDTCGDDVTSSYDPKITSISEVNGRLQVKASLNNGLVFQMEVVA